MEQVILAKVALSAATFAIDKPYDYLLPDELRESASPGMRVLIPFGAGNRRIEGIILALGQGQRNAKLKAVIALLDDNPVLDSEDPIPQEYTLEVSSPGINRKLTRPEHFEAFLEAPVRVKLIRPLENGVRELEGILIDVAENGDFEVITEEDTTVTFTRKECASVNLIEDYD